MIAPRIQPGSTVVVWSPASQSSRRYPRRLERGLAWLRAAFDVEVRVDLTDPDATPTERAAGNARILHAAATDPGVSALVATSGGWTSVGLLDELDWDLVASYPIAYLGSSDLTVLLNAVTSRAGITTYLAPMVLTVLAEYGGPDALTVTSLRDHLEPGQDGNASTIFAADWSDELLEWEERDDRPRTRRSHREVPRVLRPGSGDGTLWGGSVRSLRLLAGTPYWPKPQGPHVLVLEDEGLSAEECFGLASSLRLAGALVGCRAVLVGTHSRPRIAPDAVRELDEAILDALPGVPIVAGVAVGHTIPQITLPLGRRARVDGDSLRIDFLPPKGK